MVRGGIRALGALRRAVGAVRVPPRSAGRFANRLNVIVRSTFGRLLGIDSSTLLAAAEG